MLALPAFKPPKVALPADAKPTRELLKYRPQMPLAERDRRWDLMRKKMRMHDIDALIFLGNDIYWGMGMSNIHYMFQVDSQIGADALFTMEGEPVVWNAVQHMNRPTSMYLSIQQWMTDFRSRGGAAAIAEEVQKRGLHKSRIGVVGFGNSIQTAAFIKQEVDAVEQSLPNARFIDATGFIQEARLIKSEAEIEMLRCAGKIARKVIDAMIETARPGRTEAEVYGEMIRTQIANGGDPNIFNLLSSGPIDHPKDEIWHLLHGCEQPLSPTTRPLQLNDILISEFHTKYGGYRCHTEFTIYVGKKAPPELLKIWDVSHECLEASRYALVAGRTFREAWEMVRAPAERAGMDFVELGFHAMGTASPEFPSIVYPPGYGRPNANGFRIGDFVLQEGMTFGNNIDLHDSAWKCDVGCMLADFMVVRPGQAECLINVPRELPCTG